MISHLLKINRLIRQTQSYTVIVKELNKCIWNGKLIITLFFLLNCTTFKIYAQVFPVQANITVSQPLGVSIAELQQSTTPKIQASFLLADLNKPSYSVRLKLSIEGKGIVIKTKANVALPPVTLSPGIPVIIDHQSLNQYLQISNLDIIGIDPAKFIQSGLRLPEGNYNICVEAYDLNNPNGLPVSNKACNIVQFVEYDPPLLMPPDFQNLILFESQPPVFQQGLFTWQPMHFGFFPVEYFLEIFRGLPAMNMLPGGAIINQTSPYISIRTMNTFYSLSPTDPPLLQEDDYYAVVRIVPINYPAIFKNNGKSQFVFFNLRDNVEEQCTSPQQYRGVIERPGIALNWSAYKNCDRYVTEYYDEDIGERQYQELVINQGDKLTDTIREVYSNRTYIVRTGCRCQEDTLYSDTIRLKYLRPHAQVPDFACGIQNDSVMGLPQLLPTLNENDTIVAADLEIIVRRAIGSNGTFSGIGHIVVPYFKYARVNTAFENIKINDEYRLIAGEIQVIGVGQNILSDDFLEFLDSLNNTLEDLSEITGELSDNLDSIQAMKDILGQNMPPWLIDSIANVEAAIANAGSDKERKELEALMEALNNKVREWELMYVNIIIATIEDLSEDYDANRTQITNSYNQQFQSIQSVAILLDSDGSGIGDEEEIPPGNDDFFSGFTMIEAEESITLEEYREQNPEVGQKLINFSKIKEDYSNLIIVDKLKEELGGDVVGLGEVIRSGKVLLLVGIFIRVGEDIVPKIKAEFEERNWDLDLIADSEVVITGKIKQYVEKAINTVYWNLK